MLIPITSRFLNLCRPSQNKIKINTSIFEYFICEGIGHDIHAMECQFHINETSLNNFIKRLNGKSTAPDQTSSVSVYNHVNQLKPCELNAANFCCKVSAFQKEHNGINATVLAIPHRL